MDTTHGYVDVDGLRVYWDRDRDERVIPVARALKAALDHQGFQNLLIAVQEHEGSLIVQVQPFLKSWRF